MTPRRPFRPQDFWALARPGKVLCLMDGTYRGAAFMLAPFAQGAQPRLGTSANPVTIRALNDGQALIDGQGVRHPFQVKDIQWTVFEGFNVCCSSEDVVRIFGSSRDVTLRRIIAWNAADTPNKSDYSVWNITAKHALLEDVAGFGRGRKIFQFINSDAVTCRRCWGRWEGYESLFSKPRETFQPSYKSSNSLVENSLMTWSAEQVPQLHGHAQTVLFVTNDLTGVMRVFGSVAYVKGNAASFHASNLVDNHNGSNGDTILQDVIAVIEPGHLKSKLGFALRNPNARQASPTLTITRASFWGASGTNSIASQWTQTNVCASSTFPGACPNPYTGADGANVCKRYVDGVLTNEPLWPWPMDQRIKAALEAAGRSGLAGSAGTITSEIESLLGSVPATCRWDKLGRPSGSDMERPARR